jgi:hypothetical protein
MYGEQSPMMQFITKGMDPEQRAVEVAAAQRIVEIAHQRRQRVTGKT